MRSLVSCCVLDESVKSVCESVSQALGRDRLGIDVHDFRIANVVLPTDLAFDVENFQMLYVDCK